MESLAHHRPHYIRFNILHDFIFGSSFVVQDQFYNIIYYYIIPVMSYIIPMILLCGKISKFVQLLIIFLSSQLLKIVVVYINI